MNSPNLHSSRHSAADALLDQLERDLVLLTTASLDDDQPATAVVVDEFATELLSHWTLPAMPLARSNGRKRFR
jgi:hypothetical protein